MSLNPALEDAGFCPRCGAAATVRFPRSLHCESCGYAVFFNPKPVGCALARDADGRVWLARRGHDPGRGRWSMPGGFVDLGETVETAVARELARSCASTPRSARSWACTRARTRSALVIVFEATLHGHAADHDRGDGGQGLRARRDPVGRAGLRDRRRGAARPARRPSGAARMRAARLGRHGRDGQAEARDLRGQVELHPLGHGRRQRRDDDLVEAVDVDRVLDRVHRRRVADHALDGAAGGLLEQRERELEDLLGLGAVLILGVDDDVQAVGGVGHQQRERAALPSAARSRTASSSAGVAAVLCATTNTRAGPEDSMPGSSFRAVAHDVRTRGGGAPPACRSSSTNGQNRFARLLGLKALGEAMSRAVRSLHPRRRRPRRRRAPRARARGGAGRAPPLAPELPGPLGPARRRGPRAHPARADGPGAPHVGDDERPPRAPGARRPRHPRARRRGPPLGHRHADRQRARARRGRAARPTTRRPSASPPGSPTTRARPSPSSSTPGWASSSPTTASPRAWASRSLPPRSPRACAARSACPSATASSS